MDLRDKITTILVNQRVTAPLNASDSLRMDSFTTVMVLTELETIFGISFSMDDLTPENFSSVASMVELVSQKLTTGSA